MQNVVKLTINAFSPDRAKCKHEIFQNFKLGKTENKKQHHSKVLLNSFPMNGHTLGFCP